MGTGVITTVPGPDVESKAALLPHARRADPLHCSGGCIFFDWAPLSGYAPTNRACVVEGYNPGDDHRVILLRR
jgi:hypothetical protein